MADGPPSMDDSHHRGCDHADRSASVSIESAPRTRSQAPADSLNGLVVGRAAGDGELAIPDPKLFGHPRFDDDARAVALDRANSTRERSQLLAPSDSGIRIIRSPS